MFIPKEKLQKSLFDSLPFGKNVNVSAHPGKQFVVTRLGLITLDELNGHPYQNWYNQGPTDRWAKHG